MTTSIFQFGDIRPEFPIPVLNERAVRASAGILFFFAMISFMNAWLTGNFQPTKVFVIVFLVEFIIRVFINPQLAPIMILGTWVVRRQQPEWVGAPQKRFAWGIGLLLATTMFYLVILNNLVGPINLLVCATCLLLMFFETAFGICIGCKVYNWFNKDQAQLCPGGVCDILQTPAIQNSVYRIAIVAAFAVVAITTIIWVYGTDKQSSQPTVKATQNQSITDSTTLEKCKVPDFAKALGHEEKWKLHNNCQ